MRIDDVMVVTPTRELVSPESIPQNRGWGGGVVVSVWVCAGSSDDGSSARPQLRIESCQTMGCAHLVTSLNSDCHAHQMLYTDPLFIGTERGSYHLITGAE